jgi:hypothetical protein
VRMVFDRLFGTYRVERSDIDLRYGLVHPMASHNPLKIEFREWSALARDLWRARTLRALLGAIFMPPGWRADSAAAPRAGVQAPAAHP